MSNNNRSKITKIFSASDVKHGLSLFLDGAKREWPRVFEPTDKIELRNDHLKVCGSFLEKIKLFNSNLLNYLNTKKYISLSAVSYKLKRQRVNGIVRFRNKETALSIFDICTE